MKIMCAKHNRLCFFTWVVVAILLPQTSSAQVAWWQTLEPITSRAALTECLESLEIDNPDVIWSLYEEMAMESIEKAASFESAMKQGKGNDALTKWNRTKKWNDTRRELQQQFEVDVALTLDDHQKIIWTSFTRGLRRECIMLEMDSYRQMIILVDLLEILDKLDLSASEREDLKELCKSYEESLDILLSDWEQQHGKIVTKIFELRLRIQKGDKRANEARKQASKQLYKLVKNVKEFNNSIDEQMASLMELDHQQEFLKIITIRDFPELFTQSPADLATRRLESLDELTDEQRGIIHVIYSDYKLERSGFRQKLISAIREFGLQKHVDRRMAKLNELKKNGGDVKAYREQLQREYPDSPQLRKIRHLERQTCKTIRQLFTPEQFDNLPAEVRLYLSLWH